MVSATTLPATASTRSESTHARYVSTYCYNCVSGPDLLSVKIEGGVATEIGPNFNGRGLYPGNGKPCVKAYGLIQKTYHPDRILTPMKRTNPNKGMDQDPGFVPITWDEALDIVASKLNDIRWLVGESLRRTHQRARFDQLRAVAPERLGSTGFGPRPGLPQSDIALHARDKLRAAEDRVGPHAWPIVTRKKTPSRDTPSERAISSWLGSAPRRLAATGR